VEGIALIIRNLPLPSAEFTIGTKNVFVRSPRTVYELEQFRRLRISELAVLIQKMFRMYHARKRFQRMRHSQMIISSAWRTWRVSTSLGKVLNCMMSLILLLFSACSGMPIWHSLHWS